MPHRRLERFYREREDIADAALGLDDAWRAWIDFKLAPQPQDLDIDAPIENVFMDARGLQQIFPREGALRRLKKRKQQGILALAQWDPGRIRVDKFAAASVKHPTAKPVPAALRIARAGSPAYFLSTQDGADTREQFPEAEGFYDIIVRTEFEADNTVDFVGAMTGRDNDRNIRVRSQFSQQIQPVVLAKPQIKDDQTRMCTFETTIQFSSARHCGSRHVMLFQISGHHLPECGVVINNNNLSWNRRHQMNSL